jgi:hypothetical protein
VSEFSQQYARVNVRTPGKAQVCTPFLMVERLQFWRHVSRIVDGYYFFGAILFVFDTGFFRSRRVDESAALNG